MVAFERALRCDPYFCIAHFQLAHIHQIRGRFEKAVSHYAEAVKVAAGRKSQPKNTSVHAREQLDRLCSARTGDNCLCVRALFEHGLGADGALQSWRCGQLPRPRPPVPMSAPTRHCRPCSRLCCRGKRAAVLFKVTMRRSGPCFLPPRHSSFVLKAAGGAYR